MAPLIFAAGLDVGGDVVGMMIDGTITWGERVGAGVGVGAGEGVGTGERGVAAGIVGESKAAAGVVGESKA